MDARNWVQGATGNETLADIAEFATTGVTSVGGAVYSAGSAIVDGIGSAGSAIVDGIASW
jgi:hypothetical protein